MKGTLGFLVHLFLSAATLAAAAGTDSSSLRIVGVFIGVALFGFVVHDLVKERP